LTTPELKTKGIQKKNITNKYDEIKDAKTENGEKIEKKTENNKGNKQ
jgi:hypothetical protein